jgi:hypothetical protein
VRARRFQAALLVLASAPAVMRKPGRVLDAWEFASEPDFTGLDRQQPRSETFKGLE